MARAFTPFPDVPDRILDREAMETPRRLSRDEHRAVAGPDWTWTRPQDDEADLND